MFRRFVRAERRADRQQAAGLSPDQISSLAAANQLLESGKPAEAAPLFAGLASALDNSHPRRAANIHARAAHAFADAGQETSALDQARSALRMFIQYGMLERTPVFYANIRRKFANHNMTAAATSLKNEFNLPDSAPVPAQPTAQRHGHLPGNCPKCGAPLRAAEVDWLDERSVECTYCSSMVRTEE